MPCDLGFLGRPLEGVGRFWSPWAANFGMNFGMADRTVSRASNSARLRYGLGWRPLDPLAVSLEPIAFVGGDRFPGAAPHTIRALFGLQAPPTGGLAQRLVRQPIRS
jgi:hypothetical protein